MILVDSSNWRRAKRDDEDIVVLTCPTCKRMAALDHEINQEGVVSPSVECPYDCGFHDHIKLVGWLQ